MYNLHLRRTDGSYQTIRRPGTTAGATVNAEIIGAFYRVHSTRTLNAAPSTDSTCTQDDATQQIGCLVQASPCSIGYAGREAAVTVAGVQALKVNGLEPSVACVRNLLSGTGNVYPISRKLYLNSLAGFSASQGKEYELAKCFAKESLVNPLVTSNGFITLGQPVFCEDFAQEGCPAAGNHPAASNACANNPVELQAIDN